MKIFLLLFLALPGIARAEYKICGKLMECGVFGSADLLEQPAEARSIRIFELEPGVITLSVYQSNDPFGNRSFTLRFAEDGHFTLSIWRTIEIGEGSCRNMICQFKLDDSEWSIYAEPKRPPLQVSGTVSFANGYISRTELRKLGEATPFFFTGALGSLCANEPWRQQLAQAGKTVTEESCRVYFEMRAKLALSVKRGKARPAAAR